MRLPLTVTEEQVTYFAPGRPRAVPRPGVSRCGSGWTSRSYYGFPTYGEDTVKAAQDCGGPAVTRDSPLDAAGRRDARATSLVHAADVPLVGGPAVRSKRCLYTLTPDRDFVVSAVPGAPQVVVGLGAAHGFKFAPTFGRLLTDLAADGSTAADVSAYGLDRAGLTDPAFVPNWMV